MNQTNQVSNMHSFKVKTDGIDIFIIYHIVEKN